MTPLTTPRTPAQILLDRNERAKRAAKIEPYEEEKQQQLALEMFTNFVDSIEGSLMEIADREYDGERVIGPGIVRMCRDLADQLEELANEMKERDGEIYDLMLSEHDGDNDSVEVIHEAISQDDSTDPSVVSSGAVYSILNDAAASLRSISQEEAQELGEVSLQVAMMAVWTLRIVQSNMSRMLANSNHCSSRDVHKEHMNGDISSTGRTSRVTWSNDDDTTIISDNRSNGHVKRELGTLVEMGEEEKKDESYNSMNINGAAVAVTVVTDGSSTPTMVRSMISLHQDMILSISENSINMLSLLSLFQEFASRYTQQLATIPASPSRSPSTSLPVAGGKIPGRFRVLWPPLLPAIQQAGQHCVHQAQEHPLPATAIGLVCGPAAITTAVIIGPSVLVGDWAIQSTYNALSDTPLIETIEKAAANALQVTRLGILCSKLAIKQGVTVGEKQIQRRGGVNKICCDVIDGAVDRVMHPVETIGMAWNGMFWIGGMVRDTVGIMIEVVGCGGERMDIH